MHSDSNNHNIMKLHHFCSIIFVFLYFNVFFCQRFFFSVSCPFTSKSLILFFSLYYNVSFMLMLIFFFFFLYFHFISSIFVIYYYKQQFKHTIKNYKCFIAIGENFKDRYIFLCISLYNFFVTFSSSHFFLFYFMLNEL